MSDLHNRHLPLLSDHQRWQMGSLLNRAAEWVIVGEELLHEEMAVTLSALNSTDWLVSHNGVPHYQWKDATDTVQRFVKHIVAAKHDTTVFDVAIKLYLAEEEASLAAETAKREADWRDYQYKMNQAVAANKAANDAQEAQQLQAAMVQHLNKINHKARMIAEAEAALKQITVNTKSWTGR